MKQFIAWDKNGDGVLSKEEIVLGYKNAYGSVDEDEIDNMIKNDVTCREKGFSILKEQWKEYNKKYKDRLEEVLVSF